MTLHGGRYFRTARPCNSVLPAASSSGGVLGRNRKVSGGMSKLPRSLFVAFVRKFPLQRTVA